MDQTLRYLWGLATSKKTYWHTFAAAFTTAYDSYKKMADLSFCFFPGLQPSAGSNLGWEVKLQHVGLQFMWLVKGLPIHKGLSNNDVMHQRGRGGAYYIYRFSCLVGHWSS